jgi:hypothetical protein
MILQLCITANGIYLIPFMGPLKEDTRTLSSLYKFHSQERIIIWNNPSKWRIQTSSITIQLGIRKPLETCQDKSFLGLLHCLLLSTL